MEEDTLASILIRALHIMEKYLSCKIHVVLLPRISNTDAIIADSLSKRSNTRDSDLKYISHKAFNICHTLAEWLQQPRTD